MLDKITGSKYPDNCEMVMYSSYHTHKTTRSKLIKDLAVELTGPGTLTCPRCSEKLPGLRHSEAATCPECNLRMQVYGNALFLWEGRECSART